MRVSVRTKLVGGFLVVVALLVLLGVFALVQMGAIDANGRYIGVNSVPSIVVIDTAERAIRGYREDQLQHVIATTNAQMDALQADMQGRERVVATQLEAYRSMFTNARDEALWTSVRDGWAAYRSQSSPFLAPSRALQTKRAIAILDGRAKGTFEHLASSLVAWDQFNVDVANSELKHSASAYTSARWTVIGIVLGAALLALALGLAIARAVTRGVSEMLRAARGIAVGDVEQTVETRSRDELGDTAAAFRSMIVYLKETAAVAERIAGGDLTVAVEPKSERDALGHALTAMVENLHGLIGQVSEAASAMGSSSQQMAASSEEAGRAVGEIANAVVSVAEGAERQVLVVEQARGTAVETGAAADEALAVVREGISAAEQSHAAMEALRDSTAGVTDTMQRLASKSEEIGGIVDAITGIAEQTNLLALNAAIEAARAGDQGRGFAVVAEEVRKLAEESRTAAASIAGLVTEIQGETERAVSVVAESSRQAVESSETVEAARDAFTRIGSSVADVRGRVSQIEEAAGEVAAVAAQSSAATQQVSASTEETSASAQEVAASAQELATTAEHLAQLVDRFKLS